MQPVEQSSSDRSSKPLFSLRQGQIWEHLVFDGLVPLLTIALAMWIMPAGDVFQYSGDEGNQVAKARLLQSGYRMYQEIWSDQPPLHTILLSYWLQLFGQTLSNARGLTLALSSLLVWAFGRSIKTTVGEFPALLSVVFLLLSSSYLQLSQSVMIGLPGVALAMVSIYMLLQYEASSQIYWLAIAGFLFGASMQIKLISIILLPPLSLYLLVHRRSPQPSNNSQTASRQSISFKNILTPRAWIPAAIWLGSVIVAFGVIGIAVGAFDWQQLVGTHVQAQSAHDSGWSYSRGPGPFLALFLQDYDYLLLVIVGAIIAISQLRNQALLPLLWLGTVIPVFLYYRPLWGHYYPFLSIPMIWLGAFGIQFIVSWWRSPRPPNSQRTSTALMGRRILTGILGLALLAPVVAIPVRIPIHLRTHEKFVDQSQRYWETLAAIEDEVQPGDEWLLTDIPMYGFLSPLKALPELATVSSKRVNVGSITDEKLLALLADYEPAQVLAGRYSLFRQDISPSLRQNYRVGFQTRGLTQYLKRD